MQELRRRPGPTDRGDVDPDESRPASTSAATPRRHPLAVVLLLALVAAAVLLTQRLRSSSSSSPASSTLLTPEELSKFTGEGRSRIYVAVLGAVFDVTAGRRHYGTAGAYGFFAGRDATRGYVTGEFKGDLNDDVKGLTPEQLAEAVRWREFYANHKEYWQVGRVVGGFYDADGDPTPQLILAETQAERFTASKAAREAAGERTPLCNVSWSRAKGGWVYCSEGRRPRRVLVPVELSDGETLQERCQCLEGDGVSQAARLYPGCAADSERCQTSEPEVQQ